MMAFKRKNRWNQRQRHFGGRWPQYQAPAQWVCVIWVNTALPGLGCCFGQGSGPSAKNADRSAHLWWKQFAGTQGGICCDSAVDCSGTSPLWATKLPFCPTLTVAPPDLGQVAAAFAGLFAEFDDVPACCLGGDGNLSHSLFPITEVHRQYHLRKKNRVSGAEGETI